MTVEIPTWSLQQVDPEPLTQIRPERPVHHQRKRHGYCSYTPLAQQWNTGMKYHWDEKKLLQLWLDIILTPVRTLGWATTVEHFADPSPIIGLLEGKTYRKPPYPMVNTWSFLPFFPWTNPIIIPELQVKQPLDLSLRPVSPYLEDHPTNRQWWISRVITHL